MDEAENYPSLINCLETGDNGLALDLVFPSSVRTGGPETPLQVSPFSKTIRARIKTDGDDTIQQVHLILQRDQYDKRGSLVPVNNVVVEAAWQNAFAFHQKSDPAKPPIFFKRQIASNGQLLPYQPLFLCQETNRWFPPVCPQCGLALTLCRDDLLLEKRGLPTYSGSLDRFLVCASCNSLSPESPFYARDKVDGMPSWVCTGSDLAIQWRKLIDTQSADTNTGLPCPGCPNIESCYGPESLVGRRIVPFSFYPFYLFIFPAPSVGLSEFLPVLSGASSDYDHRGNLSGTSSAGERFLFQNEDRLFLEILYLKLMLLDQTCRHLFSQKSSDPPREMAFSIDGIGVDLYPSAEGLPSLWNFDVRILDAIGAFQNSPFAPIMPEAPFLHFLGAVWFRTLLVNSRQNASAVYAQVGRMVDQCNGERGPETLEIDVSSPAGVFAGNQIFWSPDQRRLPETWQVYWKQAMHLGFQLVHAGLRAGTSWDSGHFRSVLGALRKQIKGEMFTVHGNSATDDVKPAHSEKISLLLHRILEKWKMQAAAADRQPSPAAGPQDMVLDETLAFSSSEDGPSLSAGDRPTPEVGPDATAIPEKPVQQPVDTRWDEDGLEETVIFSAEDAAPVSDERQSGLPGPPSPAPQWEDDMEETVVLRTESTPPPPATPFPEDDMDQTVVISPRSTPPDSPSSNQDEGLAATLMQNTTVPPSSSTGSEQALPATVILNTGGPPASNKEAVSKDDDLDVTIIQGTDPQSATSPWPRGTDPVGPDRSENEDDPDATVIIRPSSQQQALKNTDSDDDISEQTIIIRSDVKKD